jgi:haloalkane dehalogenase
MTETLAAPPMPGWLERMFPAGMRRRMVDVDGMRMHVAEWGEGRPVLMLHGNPSWGFLWRKVVAELRATPGEPLRLIVPDLVGLGLSDNPRDTSVHTLVNHGRWVGNLMDRLELDDFVIALQDWGGPIGLYALEHRLRRVRGMVILNTVVGPPREGFKPSWFHRLSRVPVVSEVLFRVPFAELAMTLAQGDKTSITGRTALAYWYPMRHLPDRVAPLALARMVPNILEHPTVDALRVCQDVVTRFDGPISIVWGDRDPVLGSVIRHLERLLPHASVTRTQAGHFLQEEVPVEIAAAIREVLQRASAN